MTEQNLRFYSGGVYIPLSESKIFIPRNISSNWFSKRLFQILVPVFQNGTKGITVKVIRIPLGVYRTHLKVLTRATQVRICGDSIVSIHHNVRGCELIEYQYMRKNLPIRKSVYAVMSEQVEVFLYARVKLTYALALAALILSNIGIASFIDDFGLMLLTICLYGSIISVAFLSRISQLHEKYRER